MAQLIIKYEKLEELNKILSKLQSIIASGKDIPNEISKYDIDLIHIVNDLYKGNTLCELIIADGVRAVNKSQLHKVNCSQCKDILKKLESAKKIIGDLK